MTVWVRIAVQVCAAVVGSTALYDLVHAGLHRLDRLDHRWAQALAGLHRPHHAFHDRDLVLHDDRWRDNAVYHTVPETAFGVLGVLLMARWLSPQAVGITVALHLGMLVRRVWSRGRDLRHQPLSRVQRPASGWWVDAHYHALHHRYPDHFHGSVTTLVDRVLGTDCPLAGRVVALVGEGELTDAWVRALTAAGATTRLVRGDAVDAADAEVLLLVGAHATPETVRRFRAAHSEGLLAPTVWLHLPEASGLPDWCVQLLSDRDVMARCVTGWVRPRTVLRRWGHGLRVTHGVRRPVLARALRADRA